MSIADTIKSKATALRERATQKHRERIGTKLADKESNLASFEAQLDERERAIAAREDKLRKYYLIPRIVINLPVSIAAIAGAVWLYDAFQTDNDYQPSPAAATDSAENEFSSQWDKDWDRVSKEVDPSDPNFDGEAYCRTQSGVLTLEQCAAVVGVKQGIAE